MFGLFWISGPGETTGVTGEGVRLGGGAYSEQSGGENYHKITNVKIKFNRFDFYSDCKEHKKKENETLKCRSCSHSADGLRTEPLRQALHSQSDTQAHTEGLREEGQGRDGGGGGREKREVSGRAGGEEV